MNIEIDITRSPPNFLVLLITNSSSHIVLVPSTLVFVWWHKEAPMWAKLSFIRSR